MPHKEQALAPTTPSSETEDLVLDLGEVSSVSFSGLDKRVESLGCKVVRISCGRS